MWKRGGIYCKTVCMSFSLLADDAPIVGISEEIDDAVRHVKSVMNEREKTKNDTKEEKYVYWGVG